LGVFNSSVVVYFEVYGMEGRDEPGVSIGFLAKIFWKEYRGTLLLSILMILVFFIILQTCFHVFSPDRVFDY